MKLLVLSLLCINLISCAATRPIRKPIGSGIASAGGALLDVSVKPVEALQDSNTHVLVKIPLYVPAYAVATVGGTLGVGMFFTGFMIYPEFLN